MEERRKGKKHGNALILCAGERGVSRKEGMMNKQEQEIEKCFKQYIPAPKLIFCRFQNMRSFGQGDIDDFQCIPRPPPLRRKKELTRAFFFPPWEGKRSKRQIDEWVYIGAERGEGRGDRDGVKPRCVGLLIPPPPSVK